MIARRSSLPSIASSTLAVVAPLCLTTLLSASCVIAVETKRRGLRHRSRHGAIGKLDRHLVRHGEFVAKSVHRRHETELLQFRRMQFVRQPVNFGR